MGSLADWSGGAREFAVNADFRLSSRIRVHRVTGYTAGDVILPDARKFWSLGGPVLGVWNTSGSTITVTDADGTSITDVEDQNIALFFLISQDDAAGEWKVTVDPTDGIPLSGVNDFFYTIGGLDTGDFPRPWQYDHTGNSWSAGTDATDNMIESAGGVDAGIGYVPTTTSPYETQKYDPDTWTQEANHPVSPVDKACDSDDGELFFFGYFVAPRNRCDIYDVALDSYSTGTNYPASFRFGAATFIEAGSILCHGGTTSNFSSWSASQQAREYDTVGDSYTSKTNMPSVGRAEHGHFNLGGDVFAVGGQSSNTGATTYDRLDSYELAGDAWTSRTAYPPGTTTQIGGAARAAGVAYVAGGQGRKTARSYQVDTWSTIADHGTSNSQIRGISDTSLAVVV